MPHMKAGLDDFPQFLNIVLDEDSANTYTEKAVETPVVHRLSNGKALVMNVLKIEAIVRNIQGIGNDDQWSYHLSNKSQTAIVHEDNEECIISNRYSTHVVTSGFTFQQTRFSENYNDGHGHGFLIADKKIYAAVQGSSQASPINMGFRIMYNLVEVGANELVGLLLDA